MARRKNTAQNPSPASSVGQASPERLRARLELRRSSAAQPHVDARRKKSRGARRRDELRAHATSW